jgi:hypothetical protein
VGKGVDNVDEQQYQVFVTVKENGEISTCEVGIPVVRKEPADFFFLVGKKLAEILKENAQNYKVILNGMTPELVPIIQPIEEGTLPGDVIDLEK